MRKFKQLILALLLLLVPYVTVAAEVSIQGQVTDAESGEALPGVTVVVRGTSKGTVTDGEGSYRIKVDEDEHLVFSFLGYKSRTERVATSEKIDVEMHPEALEIDELVVVGYGALRKSDLTGAIAKVDSEDLVRSTNRSDITSALEGRVAGVYVSATEGGPGSTMNIQIRGASSVNASSDPLYVIDGFPIEIDALDLPDDGFSTTQQSAIANIDPNNIESIEILKDASATAIYGSRGANGVVLITTKSGQKGKARVSFSASVGVQTVTGKLDLMDAESYAEYMYYRSLTASSSNNYDPYYQLEMINNGQATSSSTYQNYATYADSLSTDWQDLMYSPSITQNYALNVSGGSDNVKYSVNASYYDDEGIIINNYFERYSFDSKLNLQLSPKLKMDVSTRLGHTNSNGISSGVGGNVQNTGLSQMIYRASPLKSPYDSVTDFEEEDDDGEFLNNPYAYANDVTNLTTTTRLIANMAMTYELLKGFTYKASIGANINNAKKESFYPSTTKKGDLQNGIASTGSSLNRTWVHESIFNYNKVVNKIHRINAMAGFTLEGRDAESESQTIYDFDYQELGTANLGMGLDPQIPSSSKSSSTLASFLGRVNYSLMDKYLFTVSGRADGSSRFAPGNKWAFFPSASVAWRLSEEPFLKDLGWFDNLKVRTSYGMTGNQGIGDFDWCSTMNSSNYVFNGESVSGLTLNSISNPDLQWETTTQFDAGVDIGIFGNRVLITMDYYYKRTDDMLMNVEVPITTGYDTFTMNYGSVQNQGFEFSINATAVQTKNFSYNIGANVSTNRSKVLSLGGADYISYDYTRLIVGESIGQFWGYKQIGIIETQEQLALYNQSGNFAAKMQIGQRMLADVDSSSSTDSMIVIDDDDMTIIGSAEAKFYGGMSHDFTYKNLSLGMQFTFSYGGDVMNVTKSDLITYSNTYNRLMEALDFWRPSTDADGGNTSSLTPHPSAEDLSDCIDYYVEDGSYLSLSSVTLGYSWRGSRHLKMVGISSLRLYVQGTNLLMFTPYSGLDPRASMGGSLSPGVDKGGKPFTRVYSVGVDIQF
ncbi:MAG: TonB-dependent receptor [Rikenellaceae bacterium]